MGQAQSFPPVAAIQFQCHRHTTVIGKAAGKMSDSKQIALLKQFIDLCKNNASILHKPELSFFRDWLERWVDMFSGWTHVQYMWLESTPPEKKERNMQKCLRSIYPDKGYICVEEA